jgi:hypothetical protein
MGVLMFVLRRIPRLVVAILSLAAILVVTAGSANAATGSLQVGTGTRVAGGVALDVPVTVTLVCDEGFDVGAVDLSVAQARGTSVIFAQGQGTFACTGDTQTVTVRVGGENVFRGGRALATASLLQCQDTEFGLLCSSTGIFISQEFKIRG